MAAEVRGPINFSGGQIWAGDFEFRAFDLVAATVRCVLGVPVVSQADCPAGHKQHV